jgi:hypothetical protein
MYDPLISNDEDDFDDTLKLIYETFKDNLNEDKRIKLFDVNDYATIYRYKSSFFCLDSKYKKISYYMNFTVKEEDDEFSADKIDDLIPTYVYQSLVWTNPILHELYLSGIPKKVFFEYLLPEFHIVITDSCQTWYGKRFWQYRITNAIEMGLNIYFYDFELKLLTKLHSIEDLERVEEQYNVWRNSNEISECKRLVISDVELKETEQKG